MFSLIIVYTITVATSFATAASSATTADTAAAASSIVIASADFSSFTAATSLSTVASPAVVSLPFAIIAFITEPSSVIGPPISWPSEQLADAVQGGQLRDELKLTIMAASSILFAAMQYSWLELAASRLHFASFVVVSLHSIARPSCCIAFTTEPSIAARKLIDAYSIIA